MNAEQIEQLASEVYWATWHMLDAEADTDAELCGKVATAAERAARAELATEFF